MRRICLIYLCSGFVLAGCSETGSGANWLKSDVASADVWFVPQDVKLADAAPDAPADGATGQDAKAGKDGKSGKDASVLDVPTAEVAAQDVAPEPTTPLFINEIAAEEIPDWFELYNPGDLDVDLTGWTFSDLLSDATKRAPFPANYIVPAKGFLVIEVTDEANGFKLAGDEELGVYRPDGSVADSVDWAASDSKTGSSFSRIPDGTGAFVLTKKQTPDAPNKN